MTRIATIGIYLSLLLVVSAGAVGADLLSEHFGVTLALDLSSGHTDTYQNKTSYPFLASALVPTLNTGTADYALNDWHGSWSKTNTNDANFPGWPTGTKPNGGEIYDVEAIYFDDDPQNLYISIISSFPPVPGYTDTRVNNILVVGGDLALDLGLNSEIGGFSYDYGVNLNPEHRPSSSSSNATSGGSTLGSTLYRTANGDWYVGTPSNDASGTARTNFDPLYGGFSGGYVGGVLTDYYQYHFYSGGTEVYETLAPTYVINLTIPRTMLPNLEVGEGIALGYTEGCRNDVLRLDADVDATAIPEPGTLALLGLGVAGLGARLRRRKQTPPAVPSHHLVSCHAKRSVTGE